jgi:beta-lactamase regulating signal transducer with metallopeptidase domain
VDGLLNWVWQGTVVAMAAAVMLRVLEPSYARIRYRSLWVVLLTIVLLPIVPLVWAAGSTPAAAAMTTSREPVVTIPSGWWTSIWLALSLCAVWMLGFAVRMSCAALALRRARRECRPFPPDVDARLSHWNRVRDGGRHARLVLCDRVTSAAVLAGASPLIAVAPRLLEHLTDEEIDRVVIHEWAHVQRRDDLAHLLQLTVCLCAGWHPAVWWCSRQLHLEREMACDEMAATVTGSTRAYAACLARLALLPSSSLPSIPAVAAMSASGVRRRIVRILSLDRAAWRPTRTVAAIASALVLGTTALVVSGVRAVAAEPSALERGAIAATARRASVDDGSGMVNTPLMVQRTAVDPPIPASGIQEPRRPQRQATSSPPPAVPTPTAAVAVVVTDANSELPELQLLIAAPAANVSDLAAAPGVLRAPDADAPPAGQTAPASPWSTAVDASVAVGRGSQTAAVATAGFFNRLGRRIAGSF